MVLRMEQQQRQGSIYQIVLLLRHLICICKIFCLHESSITVCVCIYARVCVLVLATEYPNTHSITKVRTI